MNHKKFSFVKKAELHALACRYCCGDQRYKNLKMLDTDGHGRCVWTREYPIGRKHSTYCRP